MKNKPIPIGGMEHIANPALVLEPPEETEIVEEKREPPPKSPPAKANPAKHRKHGKDNRT